MLSFQSNQQTFGGFDSSRELCSFTQPMPPVDGLYNYNIYVSPPSTAKFSQDIKIGSYLQNHGMSWCWSQCYSCLFNVSLNNVLEILIVWCVLQMFWNLLGRHVFTFFMWRTSLVRRSTLPHCNCLLQYKTVFKWSGCNNIGWTAFYKFWINNIMTSSAWNMRLKQKMR